MKKLLFISTISLLFSCNKERCYECIGTTYSDLNEKTEQVILKCGMSKREMKAFEKDNSVYGEYAFVVQCQKLED